MKVWINKDEGKLHIRMTNDSEIPWNDATKEKYI